MSHEEDKTPRKRATWLIVLGIVLPLVAVVGAGYATMKANEPVPVESSEDQQLEQEEAVEQEENDESPDGRDDEAQGRDDEQPTEEPQAEEPAADAS